METLIPNCGVSYHTTGLYSFHGELHLWFFVGQTCYALAKATNALIVEESLNALQLVQAVGETSFGVHLKHPAVSPKHDTMSPSGATETPMGWLYVSDTFVPQVPTIPEHDPPVGGHLLMQWL